MFKLTKSQRRALTWLLLGRKSGAPEDAPEGTPLSEQVRALTHGERPADPARVGELVDWLRELEEQVRHPDTAEKTTDAMEIPGHSPEEIRRLLAVPGLKVHVDGCCKGNPGPAGIGFAFMNAQNKVLHMDARYVGEKTNNEAEYLALIAALETARAAGVKRLTVFTDSRLMAGHLTGDFAVKSTSLYPLVKRAAELRRAFEQFEIIAVPREQNQLADRLSNEGVRRRDGV